MTSGAHGVNAIRIGEAELLLTTSGGGMTVHLTATAEPDGSGRPALHDFHFEPGRAGRLPALANYDIAALRAARWSPTTLCGRQVVTRVPQFVGTRA